MKVKSKLWFDPLLQGTEVQGLVGSLEKGDVLSVGGLAETGKGLLASLLAQRFGKSLCLVASSVKQQSQLFADIKAYSSLVTDGKLGVLHFPETESFRDRDPAIDRLVVPDFETSAEVLDVLLYLEGATRDPFIIVVTQASLLQTLPASGRLKSCLRLIRRGDPLEMDALVADLQQQGYEGEAQVSQRGHFARRGGILDLFPFQGERPVRVEFLGDRIESLRVFDVDTQASLKPIEEASWLGWPASGELKASDRAQLKDYLPTHYWIWNEMESVEQVFEIRSNQSHEEAVSQPHRVEILTHDYLHTGVLDPVIKEQRRENILRHWKSWRDQDYEVLVSCNNEGEEQRLKEWLGDAKWVNQSQWLRSSLLHGFIWPSQRLVLLSDAEIFGRYQTLPILQRREQAARARVRRESIDFSDFAEGDIVVHFHHGIGRFVGIQKVEVTGREQEVLTIEFDAGGLLHVPLEQAHLVGRYVGVGKAAPKLDKLGGVRWAKAAAQAQRSVMDYAAELLKMQAKRQLQPGFSCGPDHLWQKEFEDSFLYEETADQMTSIHETKMDMESEKPMDRLICGDVGFGKTEVAMRAAFKAVMNGKQVAVLVPTTVLAQQHDATFKERMADYPMRIDLLSRFRTKKEQRAVLEAVKLGDVDIVIGTHRLLQPDVTFKNLGLVVVDEEQRFGVKHKERFKEIFSQIDLLTLSATPIPRTLYQALMGARDMSTIETPPPNRLPVETVIAGYDERLIRSAIERELMRGGQVYFLHNRVNTIHKMKDKIQGLLPHARIDVGHGQMDEDDLEKAMMRFVNGDVDILVATTIIESGLDIPRANTIIIDRADRFGLADLYQLRGRVGRSQTKAYAYLLLPRHLMIEAHARKRVSAIKQYSELGAGFKIAMRDLEIRGAGNMLGTEQSGHITAIGFELYCQLLKQTVAKLKGEQVKPLIEVKIRFDFLPLSEDHAVDGMGAFIPRDYIPENKQRIEAYRRLAETQTMDEIRGVSDLWRDRFGQLPKSVTWLLELAKIRILGSHFGVALLEVEDGKVMMQKRGKYLQENGKFPRLEGLNKGMTDRKVTRALKQICDYIKQLA
jgi:transcription-repair coupling factor (superfamily II helicase)